MKLLHSASLFNGMKSLEMAVIEPQRLGSASSTAGDEAYQAQARPWRGEGETAPFCIPAVIYSNQGPGEGQGQRAAREICRCSRYCVTWAFREMRIRGPYSSILGSIDQPIFPVKLNHSMPLAAKDGTGTMRCDCCSLLTGRAYYHYY